MAKTPKPSTAFDDIMKAAQDLRDAGIPNRPGPVQMSPETAEHISFTIRLLNTLDGEGEFTFGDKMYRLTLEEESQS